MALYRPPVTRVLHELNAVLRPEGFRRADRTFFRSTNAGLYLGKTSELGIG